MRNARLQARLEGFDGKENKHNRRFISGSTLVLNCTVEKGQHEAGFWPTIVWSKDERPLDLRNEKSLDMHLIIVWHSMKMEPTEFSTDFRLSDARDALVFSLRVKNLSPVADSGVYSCQGDGLTRAAEIVSLPSVAANAQNAVKNWSKLLLWMMALITLPFLHFLPLFSP